MKVGVALGMGGARGWCHIGVFQALERLGVAPMAAAGSSMGSVIGAAWAGGRLEALEAFARDISPQFMLWSIDVKLFSGGLIEGREITRLLDRLELPKNFEDLGRAFGVVATDLSTGTEVWFDRGPLMPAVHASSAIPGLVCPIRFDDRWLLDGALVNPVPVSGVRRLGAERVIAVNPNATFGKPLWHPERVATPARPSDGPSLLAVQLPDAVRNWFGGGAPDPERPGQRAPNYFDVVSTSIDVMTEAILKMRLSQDPPDLVIDVDLRHIGVMELHRAEEAIAAGVAAVEAQADAILALAAPGGGEVAALA